MSRIGKIPVAVPKEVKVNIQPNRVHLEGPKGKLDISVPSGIKVEVKDNNIHIKREFDTKQDRANHGTIRATLVNMIEGVTKGHKKNLEIQGLGFRVQLQGKKIVFNLGLSHPVEYTVPDDIKVTVPDQTNISLEGVNNQRIGEIAAQIRAIKPVEPYKGKGIRYSGEIVRRKQGKSVAK